MSIFSLFPDSFKAELFLLRHLFMSIVYSILFYFNLFKIVYFQLPDLLFPSVAFLPRHLYQFHNAYYWCNYKEIINFQVQEKFTKPWKTHFEEKFELNKPARINKKPYFFQQCYSTLCKFKMLRGTGKLLINNCRKTLHRHFYEVTSNLV